MTIKQYQQINKMDSGSTMFEAELADIFQIEKDDTIENIRTKLNELMKVNEYKLKNKVYFNNKVWKWENDFLDQTFEQWIRLEQILAENDNIKNLHKLLAIYFRPCNWFGKMVKYKLSEQEEFSNELLELDMSIGTALMVFFWNVAIESMNYIRIHFLNQMNQNQKEELTQTKYE